MMEMVSCPSEILVPSQGTELWLLNPLSPRGIMWHFQTWPIKGSHVIIILSLSSFPCWISIFRVTKPLACKMMESLSAWVPEGLHKTGLLPCPPQASFHALSDQWDNTNQTEISWTALTKANITITYTGTQYLSNEWIKGKDFQLI